MVQHAHDRVHRTGFRILGAIDQSANAGMYHGTCAHGAWLYGHEQIAFIQTIVAKATTGVPEGNDFGVGRRVGIQNIAVKSASDDFSFMNNDRPDRYLAEFERSLSSTQGFLHPEFVVVARDFTRHDRIVAA